MGKSGHGPREEFMANVVDKEHPITKGMTDEFPTDDELYAKLVGEGPIHVLVSAYSDWSKKVEPLAFTVSYGKGRVYHHCFGHDVKAVVSPVVAILLARGAEWAATGKLTGPKQLGGVSQQWSFVLVAPSAGHVRERP